MKLWIDRKERVGNGDERQRCGRAISWCWCASAGRCSRRSSARSRTTDIEVAGADRLVLTEHIAVMDLMVLADALLLPDDDLALATVLKSPLFGLTKRLFALAWDRTGIAAGGAARSARPELAARLDRSARDAQRQTPFAFYAALLGPDGARKRFLARLGPEANDALDEFLNLALDYERRETPSLQGFVAWLRTAQAESSATWRSRATRCG